MKKNMLFVFLVVSTLSLSKEIIKGPANAPEESIDTIAIEEYSVMETEIKPALKRNHLYLKAGLDIMSGYSSFSPKIDGEKQKFTKGEPDSIGFNFAFENTKDITENFELGLGVGYQNNSKIKKYNGNGYTSTVGKYDSVPFYVTGKYNFSEFSNGIKPYLKGNLGYSFNFNEKDGKGTYDGENIKFKEKIDNGLYLGAGAGIEYKDITLDLMYQVVSAKASVTEISKFTDQKTRSDKDYLNSGKITLAVGYKFNY